ncbi:MAG: homoserine O-acetyltransferase [Firmicutes bacterium]|nr:homoserine O-acetyltransferase [Bacillota bacterium]
MAGTVAVATKGFAVLGTGEPGDPPLELELGGRLGPFRLRFESWGRLDPDGGNVVLVEHALTGDAHVASHDENDLPGWWEGMVGPGAPIDTERWFILAANVLGGCQGSTGPSSPAPDGRPWGLRFPLITVRDMVRAEIRLLDRLGIDRLHCVVGGSLGGMRALTWAVEAPERVGRVVAIGAPAAHSATAIAWGAAQRAAILADPAWRGGDYYGTPGPVRGLSVARQVAMITYHSWGSMERKFGRRWQLPPQGGWSDQLAVESYLAYQGEKLVDRFDANSYLYLTRAMDLYDLGGAWGGLEAALGRIRGELLLVGIASDRLYPPEEVRALYQAARRAGVRASYREMRADDGHDAFLIDLEELGPMVAGFLEREAAAA